MATQAGAVLEPVVLESFLGNAFVRGGGNGDAFAGGFRYARAVGGPALRSLSYTARAALLNRIADVLAASKDRWYAIEQRNSGNTRADAAMDVDGAIGTLKYYAKRGSELGDATFLRDGPSFRLTRAADFEGLHIGVPTEGLALHINAYNFPAWGLWEKAAVALLSGVPVVTKPATATAWLAAEMVRAVLAAEILPPGSLSLVCGPPGDLLEHVAAGDVIAFTGSAQTGETIRLHPRVRATGVRVNVEADSLNATILGPDAAPGDVIFDAFVREVVREMTAKAGQKCTAVRRILVPESVADAVAEALARGLAAVVVGDPSLDGVQMGPVVSAAQREAIKTGLQQLSAFTRVIYERAAAEDERLVYPTLLRAVDDAPLVHELEIFGPVATLVPYADAAAAFSLARRGGGSLVVSVFSGDAAFLTGAARMLASTHGRVLLVDASISESQTGHGTVLPSLIHGGPGRAGGGEELGGLRGLSLYHQWSAVQASTAVLAALAEHAADLRAC